MIAGGEPELLQYGTAWHIKHACMPYVCASLVQNVVSMCCAYVGKCEKGLCEVTSKNRESQGWQH